eukprot:Lankesteria_metandrocarpae@DN2045_c0_g1_i2.p1
MAGNVCDSSSSGLHQYRWLTVTLAILDSARKVAEEGVSRIVGSDVISRSSADSQRPPTSRRNRRIKQQQDLKLSNSSSRTSNEQSLDAAVVHRIKPYINESKLCSRNTTSGSNNFHTRHLTFRSDGSSRSLSSSDRELTRRRTEIKSNHEAGDIGPFCQIVSTQRNEHTTQHNAQHTIHTTEDTAQHTAQHTTERTAIDTNVYVVAWHGCVPPRIRSPGDDERCDAIDFKNRDRFNNFGNSSENIDLMEYTTATRARIDNSKVKRNLKTASNKDFVKRLKTEEAATTIPTTGHTVSKTCYDSSREETSRCLNSGKYGIYGDEDDCAIELPSTGRCSSRGTSSSSTAATLSLLGSPRNVSEYEQLSSCSSSYSRNISDPETPVYNPSWSAFHNHQAATECTPTAPRALYTHGGIKRSCLDVPDTQAPYEVLYVAEYPVVASALSMMINTPNDISRTPSPTAGLTQQETTVSQETATFRESRLDNSMIDVDDDADSGSYVEATEHPALRYIIAWRAALTQDGSYLYPKSVFEDVYTGGDLMIEFQAFAVLIWRFEAELATEHKKEIRIAFQRMRVEAEIVSHIEDLLSRNIVDERPLDLACSRARETGIANTSLDLLQFRLSQIQTENKALANLIAAEGNYDSMNSLLLDIDKVLRRPIISADLLEVLTSLLQQSKETNALIALPTELASVIEYSSLTGLHCSKAIIATNAPRYSFSYQTSEVEEFDDLPSSLGGTAIGNHQVGGSNKSISYETEWSSDGSFEDTGYSRAKSRRTIFSDPFCVGYITTEGYFTAARKNEGTEAAMLKMQRTSKAFWATKLSMGSNLERMTADLKKEPHMRKGMSKAMKERYPSKKKGVSADIAQGEACGCCGCCRSHVPSEETTEVLAK